VSGGRKAVVVRLTGPLEAAQFVKGTIESRGHRLWVSIKAQTGSSAARATGVASPHDGATGGNACSTGKESRRVGATTGIDVPFSEST
jgi:hypothetical protein